jgi:hypothetical protein
MRLKGLVFKDKGESRSAKGMVAFRPFSENLGKKEFLSPTYAASLSAAVTVGGLLPVCNWLFFLVYWYTPVTNWLS